MPIMLAATILAARWIVRRCAVPLNPAARLTMGGVAFVMMLAAEFLLVLRVRGMTLSEYFAARDPVSGTVYYLLLCVFALMPQWVERSRHHPSEGVLTRSTRLVK